MDGTTLGVVVSIVVAVVTAAVGYGMTRQSVSDMRDRMRDLTNRVVANEARVNTVEVGFARIETMLTNLTAQVEKLNNTLKET